MKKIYALGTVAMALLTAGCSNELTDNNQSGIDDTGKERILFSAGDDGQATVKTRAGFTAQTRIVARIVSDSRDVSEADKCVTTVLSADVEASGKGYSNVAYAPGSDNTTYARYWDDAYGRRSILSVYAVAIPNKVTKTVNNVAVNILPDDILKGAATWAEADASDNTLKWTVNKNQTTATLDEEDLTYSNNIQAGDVGAPSVFTWSYSSPEGYPTPAWDGVNKKMNAIKHTYGSEPVVTDGRLYFTQQGKNINEALTDAPGHFDKGHMDFKHSLSRIQVNLIKGAGYTSTFDVTQMQVLGQSITGTFDIKNATWSNKGAGTAINMATMTTVSGKAATYEAQMLPGYTFANNATNVLQLTVDGNTYYITNAMLRTALDGKQGVNAEFSTEMGTRYIFDVTVNKAKIENITATIVDWNNVTAKETELDNSHVTFTFKSPVGSTNCGIDDINFYKYEQTLDKVYTDNSYSAPASYTKTKPFAGPATLTDEDNDYKFETNWYYNDNQTAYHFRTLNDKAASTLDSSTKNKFTMSAGATASTDYHWGAPMDKDASNYLKYDETVGFQNSIAKGIVSATKQTNLTVQEVHMMSNIVVDLKTVTGNAAIDLENAEVTITKLYGSANVDMGIGLITTTGTLGNENMTRVTNTKTASSFTYSVIPQKLDRGSGTSQYVGITIKTKDNNEYYIIADLSSITASSVDDQRNQTQGQAIKTWFPGHTYKYTFTLSKKKIEMITATVANWINVTADNTDLDLEK